MGTFIIININVYRATPRKLAVYAGVMGWWGFHFLLWVYQEFLHRLYSFWERDSILKH